MLVTADVGADDELAGAWARVDGLRPVGRRYQELRPARAGDTPNLRHATQVAHKHEISVGIEMPRVRRAHAQKLSQICHSPCEPSMTRGTGVRGYPDMAVCQSPLGPPQVSVSPDP